MISASANINEKYWNNIFENLESKKYYTKKNELILNKNIIKKSEDISIFKYNKHKKIINIENKIYEKKNNTILFLLKEETKIYSNKYINNELINYDIYILHPYHNDCKFNINLNYCKNTLNLEKICLKRYSVEKANNYWEDNNSDIKEKYEGEFLFGKNIKIKKDLKYYKLKNKLNLYKNEYPYMYENKEEKENIKYKLPNNIKIEIPKRMNIINKIKIKWKFKNEYTRNILELKINNTEIEEINNFKYLI